MRVLKTMGKKLKSNRGFTLVEMLVALAIVVMLSLMMSYGVSVGAAVQRESTFVAESDVLASTINTALGDVLRYASVREVAPAEDEASADYEQLEVMKTLLTMEKADGSVVKCLIDTDGYGIGGGAIILNTYEGEKRVAVSQYVTQSPTGDVADTVTTEKVYYLVSHGLYTNLEIMTDVDHKFELQYVVDGTNKYFHAHYWIAEKNPSKPLKKEVNAYFRVAND